MESTKILATALGATVALALIGLQSSVAQPGSAFETRGILQSEGYTGCPQPRRAQWSPPSGQLVRHRAIEACMAQAQSQVPGACNSCVQQRYLIYSSCMYSYRQRP